MVSGFKELSFNGFRFSNGFNKLIFNDFQQIDFQQIFCQSNLGITHS